MCVCQLTCWNGCGAVPVTMATLASLSLLAPPPLAVSPPLLFPTHRKSKIMWLCWRRVGGKQAGGVASSKYPPPLLRLLEIGTLSAAASSLLVVTHLCFSPHPPWGVLSSSRSSSNHCVLLLSHYSRLLLVLVLLTLFRGTLCDGLLSRLLVAAKWGKPPGFFFVCVCVFVSVLWASAASECLQQVQAGLSEPYIMFGPHSCAGRNGSGLF